MTSIFDYEHLNAMQFVEPDAIVEDIHDELPDMALERGRLLTAQSNAMAAPRVCLTSDT